jgi:thioredoxin-like negative regulator of GroEL
MSIVVESAKDKLKVPVQEIDIEEDWAVATRYGIRSVPTMILLDDADNEVKRKVGTMNEEQLLEFAA